MADVFPPRNLPSEATPWAREVETRTDSALKQIEILRKSTAGQNRNTAASLSTMAAQLNDLTGRFTVGAQAGAGDYHITLNTSGPGGPISEGVGPTVQFTLNEPRVVSLTASFRAFVASRSPSDSAARARAVTFVRVALNGASQSGAEDIQQVDSYSPIGEYSEGTLDGRISCTLVRTLAAGTYSAQAFASGVQVYDQAESGLPFWGQVAISGASIRVEVNQRA